MVRYCLVQVIAQVPPQAQPVGGHPDQLSLRSHSLEEHDQLELEEDNRVDRGATDRGVAVGHDVADEAQVQLGVEVAIQVVRWDEGLQREVAERSEAPHVGTHHGTAPSEPGSEED